MRKTSQEYIANLSMDLMVHGLALLQAKALPVYRQNIDRRDPPFAHGEFTPSCIAVLLLVTGLDYHLSRLKYLRDIAPHKPPLPHTPYFNWIIGDALSIKLERLLITHREKRLKEELVEMTVLRDAVAHPKLYAVKEIIGLDLTFGRSTAKLPLGEVLRNKALSRKRKRSEHTRILRLPIVPTWISYRDAVMCVMIVNRFLNLLERKYGNPYAWVGNLSVRNEPIGFLTGAGNATRRSIPFNEWTRAFFNSLSNADQVLVTKRLGGNIAKYLDKPPLPPLRIGNGSMTSILRAMKDPPKPEFLKKPPPWMGKGVP